MLVNGKSAEGNLMACGAVGIVYPIYLRGYRGHLDRNLNAAGRRCLRSWL